MLLLLISMVRSSIKYDSLFRHFGLVRTYEQKSHWLAIIRKVFLVPLCLLIKTWKVLNCKIFIFLLDYYGKYSLWVRVNCSKCICSNLDCSTLFSKMSSARHKKCQLLDRQKYAVRVPHFVFEQMIKKVQLLEISSSWQNFCDSKK